MGDSCYKGGDCYEICESCAMCGPPAAQPYAPLRRVRLHAALDEILERRRDVVGEVRTPSAQFAEHLVCHLPGFMNTRSGGNIRGRGTATRVINGRVKALVDPS